MADTSVSFKCPNCTGPLSYVPGQSEIVCEYCGTRLSVADLEAYYARNEQKMLRAFQCPSCGAEIVTDDNTMATECCYCGNPTMISARYEGALRPDYVIPFQKTRDEAKEAFRAFYEGKRLLPDNFLSDTRIDSIQGMYVPFWLFDSCVTATGSYRAKTVRTYRRGNCEVTEAEYYECQREGSLAFSKVPVDGSRRMDDTWMESIGPYDYSFLQRGGTPGPGAGGTRGPGGTGKDRDRVHLVRAAGSLCHERCRKQGVLRHGPCVDPDHALPGRALHLPHERPKREVRRQTAH